MRNINMVETPQQNKKRGRNQEFKMKLKGPMESRESEKETGHRLQARQYSLSALQFARMIATNALGILAILALVVFGLSRGSGSNSSHLAGKDNIVLSESLEERSNQISGGNLIQHQQWRAEESSQLRQDHFSTESTNHPAKQHRKIKSQHPQKALNDHESMRKLKMGSVRVLTFPPTFQPSARPSTTPSEPPTDVPSANPSMAPSIVPSTSPSISSAPSVSKAPSTSPTLSNAPSVSSAPTAPSAQPSSSYTPSLEPTGEPSVGPTIFSGTFPPTIPPTNYYYLGSRNRKRMGMRKGMGTPAQSGGLQAFAGTNGGKEFDAAQLQDLSQYLPNQFLNLFGGN